MRFSVHRYDDVRFFSLPPPSNFRKNKNKIQMKILHASCAFKSNIKLLIRIVRVTASQSIGKQLLKKK